MKQITQLLSLSLVTATLLLASCTKPDNKRTPDTSFNPGINTSPPPTYQGGVKIPAYTLFAELRSTPQVYCITAGIPQTVTGTKGTKLMFYPNSFKYANGNIVTDGTVCIELVEMLTPGAMIANMATTQTTDNQLLHSGGQVYINATKNGEKLYANKYGIAYPQPAASTVPMNLYYGNRNNEDSIVLWRPLDPATTGGIGTRLGSTFFDTGIAPSSPTSLDSNYYFFQSCTNFAYVNCDVLLYLTVPKTNIHFILPDSSFNNGNTLIFTHITNINSVHVPLFYSKATNTFDLGSTSAIPVGYNINVLALCKKTDGTYYFSEQTGLTITDAMSINIPMTERSLDYIKTRLGAL